MRSDMDKVIVERPRRGGGFRSEWPAPIDLEDSPRQEGLKRRHRSTKRLNENLRPLERFLAAQVGRPWDKVYSEICAGIDRRNTVQQHIHQHIDDFVARRVVVVEGVLHEDIGHGRYHPLSLYWASRFYVDPNSRLLRLNKHRDRTRAEYRDMRRAHAAGEREGLRDGRVVVDATVQLHRIEGIWFRVSVAPVIGNEGKPDTLRHLPAQQCPRWDDGKRGNSNHTLFGDDRLFAIGKRQLSARELRHFRLRNDAAQHRHRASVIRVAHGDRP